MGIFDYFKGDQHYKDSADRFAYSYAFDRWHHGWSLEEYMISYDDLIEKDTDYIIKRTDELFYVSVEQKEEIFKQSLFYFNNYSDRLDKALKQWKRLSESTTMYERSSRKAAPPLDDWKSDPFYSPEDYSAGCLKSFKSRYEPESPYSEYRRIPALNFERSIRPKIQEENPSKKNLKGSLTFC